MTLTRWKVMAGTLGVSLCGLAAVADTPKPPVPVPAPNVVELPPLPAPSPAPPAVEPPPVLVPAPAVAAAPISESAPAPKVVELKLPEPTPGMVVGWNKEPSTPTPAIIPAAAFEAAPVAPTPAAPTLPAIATPAAEPAPVPAVQPYVNTINAAPTPTPVVLTANVNSTPTPAVAPVATAAPVTTAAVSPTEKKLRVLLNMGEDRPRFEVKDGEETLLRLVSDKVDVKCPEPGDASAQTMRAVGAVAFVTPGGEGNCDELTLVPGTGQVVVSGKVRFRYHWGKVETEVAGDRMTFKLGTGPASVVPAAYTPGR